MPASIDLAFVLDARPVRVTVPPAASALDVLREVLDVTSVKPACRIGRCGACMVLVDGRPTNACLMLAARLDGREIVTVEGLAADPDALAIGRAFAEEGALQCGYCTPGFVVSLVAARRERGDLPTLERAVTAHLCRCTGYGGLKRALLRLAAEDEAAGAPAAGRSGG